MLQTGRLRTTLTGRYTVSPETVLDSDLNRLKGVSTPDALLSVLNAAITSTATNDFWTITLPAALDSSSARNSELFAYVAGQNLLRAKVLLSHKTVAALIDPALKAKKKALERHHLFPRAWLEK